MNKKNLAQQHLWEVKEEMEEDSRLTPNQQRKLADMIEEVFDKYDEFLVESDNDDDDD